MAIIEIEGLRKVYRGALRRRTLAVDGLDLSVPEGGVFGFLGPNGAGKTTTIRCLLGLVRPSSGSCRLLGVDSRKGLASVIRRVGSIVETPAFSPRLSGRRNLQLLGGLNDVGRPAVGAVLDQVGLGERARDPVGTYSLGMRQRLGIAAALLKDPEVLVLDEPATGLDPAGIKEVRELLRRLGDEGRTVFVSSHILSEVQNIADSIAILRRGRLVTAGPVSSVLASGGAAGFVVRLDDVEAGMAALQAASLTASRRDDGAIRVDGAATDATAITRALAERHLYLAELRRDEVDLETVFLELTRDPEDDRA